jgi:SAM-dependent methyltransferase
VDDQRDPGRSLWQRTSAENLGEDYARRYAEHFDALAASGTDIHGEVGFLRGLLGPGDRVLDAGCGTGRIATRLHEEGYAATGVDADPAMIEVARERSPQVRWHVADLAEFDLGLDLGLDLGERFDVVVLAGNVVPFVEGSLRQVCARLAAHLAPQGRLVCGYGLDRAHLPSGAREVPFADFDAACAAAGLRLLSHHAGWDGAAYDGGGYSLSVHGHAPADATG